VKRGKAVLAVSAYNTSRECFLCGGINQNLSLEDRIFHCPHCGFTLDRDLNASLVLLRSRVGATLLVCLSLSFAQYLPHLPRVKGEHGGAMIREAPASGMGSSPTALLHLVVINSSASRSSR